MPPAIVTAVNFMLRLSIRLPQRECAFKPDKDCLMESSIYHLEDMLARETEATVRACSMNQKELCPFAKERNLLNIGEIK